MRLMGDPRSGNVYKAQLLLAWLGKDYEHVPTSWEGGGTGTPEFLALNPNGKVPCLVDGDFVLWESNAILQYLARQTPYWPEMRRPQAEVLQWLFFEQYSHEPYIATSRALAHFSPPGAATDAKIASKRECGLHALAVMEEHLTGREWFVGRSPTIADIALYAYTHVAPEGGFDLGPYPSIRAWLQRVAHAPGVAATVPIGFTGPTPVVA